MANTLVNFRIPQKLLDQFDGTCRLAGLTRTQLLRQLIVSHVRDTCASLPERIEEDRQITARIKNALRKREKDGLVSHATNRRIGVPRRFKSFSQHVSERGI